MLLLLVSAVALAADGLTMCTVSTAVKVTEAAGTACGLTEDTLHPEGFHFASVSKTFFNAMQKCGVCYEVTSDAGSVNVMVNDVCNTEDDDCTATDRTTFFLPEAAYTAVAGDTEGMFDLVALIS